ncbi:MAG: CAP domain-containing protein, partial [Chloroflexi bacterium]|nr:CAP domain-containing protein [Chloroflexota bacterium]
MLVAFVVFIAIHATNGFGFGESWSMAFKDFRMAFTCPQEPGKVWEFIDRSEVEELQLQIAQERGEDIYIRACTEGVAVVPATPTPSTPTQIPVSIPTPVPSTTPVSTAVPAAPGLPTQAPASIVTATVPASPTPSPPPDQVLQTLVQYMLALINDDRLENGLQPVILGTNPAAQQHAEEMLSEGYLAHWGLDGLKPYMRYTLSGGYNYGAENVSGPPYYSDPDIYRHENVLDLLKETQSGLMESPGHRRNILNKWHKKVNIGIAFNESAVSVVQQFEGNYIEFTKLPSIENGVLSFSGSTRGGFLLKSVQVWYDQAPHSLTLGQVGSTHCYTAGTPIVFLRPPLSTGAYYTEDESSYT